MNERIAKVLGLLLLTACAASACGQNEPPNELIANPSGLIVRPGEPTDRPSEPTVRPDDARILGVPDGAECDPSVVDYVKYDFRLELHANGQEGDVFGYEILKKDGEVVTQTSNEFEEGATGISLPTGVTTFDVERILITAQGSTGIGGTCVLTLPSS